MQRRAHFWRVAFLVAVCGALALALPVAARAAVPPSVIGLRSASHSDAGTWYANSNPIFSWASFAASGTAVDGYAYLLDQNPATDPGTAITAPALSLAAQQTYAVGSFPQGIAAADLNGDGHADLAVTNAGNDTVGVLLSKGDGSLAAQQTYAVGGIPRSIAAADLNGDGHADLAVTNGGGTTISVLLGKGDGSFAAQQTYAVGSGPWGITAADLNGDGHPDLAVTNTGGTTVSVLLNNGTGVFTTPAPTYAVGSSPGAIATVDLNGDGHPDLAVTNESDKTVSVLLGKGNGGFAAQQTYAVGSAPWGIAIVDLNGDGHPDLAVTNESDKTVSALLDRAGLASFTGKPDGAYYFHIRAHDSAGNWGPPSDLQVNIDTTAPATAALGLSSDANAGWQKAATVSLAASDALSGPAATYYTIDGGAKQTYSAPFGLADGAHTVAYWSVDKAGNVEAAHNGYANIDTKAPTAKAKALNVRAAKAKKGKTLKFRITVADPIPGCGNATLTLTLTTTKGKKLWRLVEAGQPTNKALVVSYKLKKKLKKGTYSIVCKSTDAAGNVQARATKAKLKIT